MSAHPQIDDTAWIAPNATVVGEVTIGPRCGVWYGAVIRTESATIQVGEESNIQDNCVLHADPGFAVQVGARVSVGHAAILHGCTIEDDVLVGMGAIVLNGAVIGARSLIGAGALIPEGAQIPPDSLVIGSPGTVRRSTTPDEHERIRQNASVYVDRLPTGSGQRPGP